MPTAFVTGATAGIGAAFARRLAADRFRLVLLARDSARLERAAEQYRKEHGTDVEVIAADLTTDEGLAAAERRAAQGVDLLVNNAGFGQREGFLKTPLADELSMLRVHCEAVLRLSHAALPGMVERGRGGIINVASVAAFFTRGTYGASKAWVVEFSRSLRQELTGTGVRVLALCPGWVRTEFHDRAGMDMSGTPEFMWLDADTVVDAAVRDFRRNRAVSIPGVQYKAVVGLGRFLPRELSAIVSARVGRRHH